MLDRFITPGWQQGYSVIRWNNISTPFPVEIRNVNHFENDNVVFRVSQN
jgi:hypothetical protein